jgi:hypothetical protein
MGLNGHQLFVWEGDAKRVADLINRYVKEVGCAAATNFDSDTASPVMARRTQRQFTLSDPKNGIIAIWEDGAWGDKKLARYLSKELETRAMWLGLSAVTDQWAYVIYSNGSVADSRNETIEEFYEKANAFAKRHTLPFALIYLPDPNMAARYQQMKKDIGTDWLHSEPDIEGLEIEEVNADELDPQEAAEIQAEEQARGRLQAEVAKFPKLTISCK